MFLDEMIHSKAPRLLSSNELTSSDIVARKLQMILDKEYNGIMLFDSDEDSVKSVLENHSFTKKKSFFHSHFSEDGKAILLYSK